MFSFKYLAVSCPILEASEIPFIFLKDLNPKRRKIIARPTITRATSKNANQVFSPKSTNPNAKEISKNNNARFISKNEVMTNPKPMPNFLAE